MNFERQQIKQLIIKWMLTRNIFVKQLTGMTRLWAGASKSKLGLDMLQDEKNQFENQYEEKVERLSILREFRRDVLSKGDIALQFKSLEKLENQRNQEFKKKVTRGNKQTLVKNAREMGLKIINNRNVFEAGSPRMTMNDRGDYALYDSIKPHIQDQRLSPHEQLQDSQIFTRGYNFLDKLSPDYQEHYQIKVKMDQTSEQLSQSSLADLGKRMQNVMDVGKMITETKRDRFETVSNSLKEEMKTSMEEEGYHIQNQGYNETTTGIGQNLDEGTDATLSPVAINTIFDLYLQGWSVRDISHRYGILPARTKFCIWTRAQLFYEVLPKMGMIWYIQTMGLMHQFYHQQEQQEYNTIFCDYGLDLEWLDNAKIIESISHWSKDYVDAAKPDQRFTQALTKLEKMNKFNKYQIIQVGTHGTSNAMYRLNQWRIFRGKGSDHYHLKNHTFRKHTLAKKKFTHVYY